MYIKSSKTWEIDLIICVQLVRRQRGCTIHILQSRLICKQVCQTALYCDWRTFFGLVLFLVAKKCVWVHTWVFCIFQFSWKCIPTIHLSLFPCKYYWLKICLVCEFSSDFCFVTIIFATVTSGLRKYLLYPMLIIEKSIHVLISITSFHVAIEMTPFPTSKR